MRIASLSDPRRILLACLGWAAVLALAWLVYRPGLSGGFLFDDHVNLDALGATGPIDDAAAFWRYLTSGTADPFGRPLSLLTFLIDARNWPADPAPFLRTNLLLHLLNATLLFVLLRRLGRLLGPDDARNDASAALGAGLWLLHPLLVSTTLYVVQREAMLPATFVLLGLLAYAHGRTRLAAGHGGLAWMLGGLVLGTVLATLSKANGVLLPLLLLVLEATVFGTDAARITDAASARRHARLRLAGLVLPSLALAVYLGLRLLRWNQAPSLRPWTIGERVLTEGRVLVDYLQLLAIPRSVSTGLYNDGYVVSTGLFAPATTLLCWIAVLAAIGAAWAWRRRLPALAAGLLFFFAGHVLESTTLPLELYFEHRNYLPAMLLFWPLARALCFARLKVGLRIAAAAGLLGLCALTTYHRVGIWGEPARLAELWAAQNPGSSRVQATLAIEYMRNGRSDLALARLDPLWRERPRDLQIGLNTINAACTAGGITPDHATRLAEALRRADRDTMLVRQWLANAIHSAGAGTCRGLGLDMVERWLAAAEANPAITVAGAGGQSIASLRGLLALERGDAEAARRWFDQAIAGNASPQTAIGQVATLASAGHYAQALAHLEAYERVDKPTRSPSSGMRYVHARVLARQRYWENEIALLRGKLEAEIAAQERSR